MKLKMKLKMNNWLLFAAGVLAVVIASLGIVYIRQVERQEELNEQFAQTMANPAQTEIANLNSKRDELEAQVTSVTSQLEMMRNGIPNQSVSSITRALFDVARSHNMDVTELVSSIPSRQKLDGVEFSLLSLTLRAEGDALKMADFVIALNGSFSTGFIESVNLTMPENSGDKAIIEVDMAVYSN